MRCEGFADLRVWQEAKRLVVLIYSSTRSFPKDEMFGLTSQLRRSTNSVCANIAEGFSRFHSKDKIKFYYNARGSISESQSHIIIAKELGYIPAEISSKMLNDFDAVRKMLNGMIRSVAKSPYFKKK